ncbi:hypothetical protein Q5P01_021120 [Channa striata]|uniref:Uncharacterized protein n=1 Tax=Channa striata TaxID=64152 RepID=A0AA88LTP2_CHASR|nr:hypothetical protein Q5P01_021120 [Channa striata]
MDSSLGEGGRLPNGTSPSACPQLVLTGAGVVVLPSTIRPSPPTNGCQLFPGCELSLMLKPQRYIQAAHIQEGKWVNNNHTGTT